MAMKRLPCLLLCILFQLLAGTVEALNAAAGAELTFFYQAYLLEQQHVTDQTRRGIAPKCAEEINKEKCGFFEFVNYISSQEAFDKNNASDKKKEEFRAIFDEAEKSEASLVDTSEKLRDLKFEAGYAQDRLYPKEKETESVAVAIRGMRNIVTGTKKNKYPDEKKKMIEALELLSEVRQADNMKYFIPKLQAKLDVTLETKSVKTSDGITYTTYDVDETAKKNDGVEDVAKKINSAAEALRKSKRGNGADISFVIHQGIIKEANESLTELKKKCP